MCFDLFSVPFLGRECAICLEKTKGLFFAEEFIGHEKGGELHPIHRNCIKEWAKQKGYGSIPCPGCRQLINTNSLVQWTDGIGVKILNATIGGMGAMASIAAPTMMGWTPRPAMLIGLLAPAIAYLTERVLEEVPQLEIKRALYQTSKTYGNKVLILGSLITLADTILNQAEGYSALMSGIKTVVSAESSIVTGIVMTFAAKKLISNTKIVPSLILKGLVFFLAISRIFEMLTF